MLYYYKGTVSVNGLTKKFLDINKIKGGFLFILTAYIVNIIETIIRFIAP